MNLVLIGMPGAGKTSVGLKTAEELGRAFADTDRLIEARHGEIPEIFRRAGEEGFRAFERETVRTLSEQDGMVIATGGGTALDGENVSHLKAHGKIVYLRAGTETLLRRLLRGGGRPLLAGADTEEKLRSKIEELRRVRERSYEDAADEILDTDGMTIEKAAKRVASLYKEEI